MKLNQDLYLKIFLVLVILSLVGYLIYAIIAGAAKCNADNFANKMKNRLHNISFARNPSREGFQNAKPTLKLYFANWCPHCSKFVSNGQETELYKNFTKSVEHLVDVQPFQDCATFKDYPKQVEGFPTWLGNNGSGFVNVTPTLDGVQSFVNGN